MITSITFQFGYNKAYLNQSLQIGHTYGDLNTHQLQKQLQLDIARLGRIENLLADLNYDLTTTHIKEKITEHLGEYFTVRDITKTKRTYNVAGLTIHEDDKIIIPPVCSEEKAGWALNQFKTN